MASPLRLNTIRNEEQFYHPPLPPATPQMTSMPQGGGSAMSTGIQYPDGFPPDTSNLPPAYLPGDQELISLIDRNLAQPDVASQPPSSGLQLASSTGGGGGSSDFNWLTAIGAGLQSAGAAHFGNYGVAQNYLQMKQQADQRKQLFAQQQAQLEEQKRQHDMQMLERIVGSSLPSNVKMEQLKQLKSPQALALAQGIKEADLANFKSYQRYIPQAVMQRFAAGEMEPAEVSGWVEMAKEEHKVNLKEDIKSAKLSTALETPEEQRTPFQRMLVDEHTAALENKKADTQLKQAHAAEVNKKAEMGNSRFTETANVVSAGLFLKPGEALKPDELVNADDVKRAQSLGETVVEGEPRLTALARIAQKSIPTSVAGAKAAASVENTQRVKLISGERLGNFVNRKAFIQGRTIGPQTALTEADAANPEWLELSDKQTQDLRLLNQARASQDLVFDLAEGLGQMEGPGAAFVKGLKNRFGAYTKANPLAAAFMGDRKAFATYFRNLQESGVMTEQDRAAYESLLPDERETVASFKVKKVILREIMDISDRAYRAAIAKDDTAFNENRQAFKEALASAMAIKKAQKGDQKSLDSLFEKRYGGAK